MTCIASKDTVQAEAKCYSDPSSILLDNILINIFVVATTNQDS